MWHARKMRCSALTIHESDSQGRRGLQADLAVFYAHGLHAQTVVTGFYSRNSAEEEGHPISSDDFSSQLRSVYASCAPQSVKVGSIDDEIPLGELMGLMDRFPSSWVVECPKKVHSFEKKKDAETNAAREEMLFFARKCSLFILSRCEAESLFVVDIVDKKSAVKAAHLFLKREGQAIWIYADSASTNEDGHRGKHILGFFSDGKARIKVYEQRVARTEEFFKSSTVFSAAVCGYLAESTGIVDAVEHAMDFVEKMKTWPRQMALSTFAENAALVSSTEQDLLDEKWMKVCMEEAAKAGAQGDVPVGAIVVRQEKVVGRGSNRREQDQDPTAHAELLALREAAAILRGWRLKDCTLYVTLEPCAMCAGALVNARLGRVVFGATDEKGGAVGSLRNICQDERLNHVVEVKSGVCASKCKAQLQEFFRELRKRDSSSGGA